LEKSAEKTSFRREIDRFGKAMSSFRRHRPRGATHLRVEWLFHRRIGGKVTFYSRGEYRATADCDSGSGIGLRVIVRRAALKWSRHWSNIPQEHDLECAMRVSVTEAKGQLTELVRRAEAGEEIILTRHGHPAVRLTAIRNVLGPDQRLALLDSLSAKAAAKAAKGPTATHSQDFLYNDDGLPE
jgi:prevent-host-death family protein